MTFDSGLALAIAGLTVCGVVMRPRGWPEAIWAVLGAAAVVLLGLLPWLPPRAASMSISFSPA
jgi:Na+/H+ antiporter NhaD/arsenite permease-like protein